MGITKSFFTEPIVVPVTLRQNVKTKTGFESVDYSVVFTMNRETVGQKNGLAVAASLFSAADNLERFCKMLAFEPEGIDDFPQGKKPLEEKALEYFSPAGYADLIQYVVMEVERAQKPVEFFRGF